ncbi:peroxidase 27-like [Cornus florida]|uniref:peroxidase 27-like n=1 Tax=Cornus florida TaxID=4283 RepID=UPI0028A02779|nr:peroxidase 27-like [Cornus florida]
MALFQKLLSVFILVVLVLDLANAQGLKLGFYSKTCPSAEAIVKRTTAQFVSRAPSLAAPLLRMHFHDCFVRGCDGSVLLNSTRNNQTEKSAFPNQSLRGFQVIDAAKSAVEKKCPGVVSCADILALVARDAVSAINGPSWAVPLGRRDGRVSILSDALTNLPSPFANITQLKAAFSSKGLTVKDLGVLSGAHTIGISHCTSFTNRLYNFTGKGDTDPALDSKYIAQLKKKCKPGDATTFVAMDPGSPNKFDADYYTLVSKRRGLFQSDAALVNDNVTGAYVKLQATSGSTFFKDFAAAMVKMGGIQVLTGNAGEIRKQCAFIN